MPPAEIAPSAPAAPRPVARPPEAGAPVEPRGESPPQGAPRHEIATGTLVIVSKPPGAHVYLDDEPLGSTDPENGRLVKSDVAAGPHRVRVSGPGHQDTTLTVEVPPGDRVVLPAQLAPVASADSDRGRLLTFAAGALVVAAAIIWIALRRPESRAPASWGPTPRPGRTTGGAQPAPSTPVTPGARRDELGDQWFGEYRLLELLGRGGMASVYRAERRDEQVALKRPLGTLLDDPDFLQRFAREAEISRSMNHPNIARILERGEVEGVPYFTMELLDGESLQAVIRKRGAAEPRVAAAIVAQVAEALDFAHSKGVIHRDLKPSNIMLLPDGTAKVMDFGIARGRSFDGLTVTGAFLGTPDYVAPETMEGLGTDARSDLYALGMVFYELLAGRLPFAGAAPFAVLKRRLAEDPPPPSSIEGRVPAELDAIVLRLLRRSPAERPGSAEELVVALREWLNRAA
jgi:hypothetical protein